MDEAGLSGPPPHISVPSMGLCPSQGQGTQEKPGPAAQAVDTNPSPHSVFWGQASSAHLKPPSQSPKRFAKPKISLNPGCSCLCLRTDCGNCGILTPGYISHYQSLKPSDL